MEGGLEHAGSWLCPDPGDRERLLEMDARLRRARTIALSFLAVALVAAGPFVGWWTLLVLAGTALSWRVLAIGIEHRRKPEWSIAAAWLLSVLAIAVSILLTGGADSPAKSWLLIPAITLPARFTNRGLNAGVAITMALLAAVTIGADPGMVGDRPQLFLFPAALIGAAMALSMALRSAEIHHRTEAVIDQLTGMLNRKALDSRAAELEQQSRVSSQPVGLIICDIDHFKRVNDTYGHATGDAVLRDFAYRIRKELRAYDLAYRVGGEEFVVLLPGATVEQTQELAERLLVKVADESVEGISVTASFGVAVSGAGGLHFERLFEAADEALYRAKAGGRNQVCQPQDAAVLTA
jgi:diguanylate cyclase (GGDEF)-like protein